TTQADIVEEIVRFYGFNNIPVSNSLHMPMVHSKGINKDKVIGQISDTLTACGFAEIMCTSLMSSKFVQDSSVVKLANPLSSDLDILRNSLLNNGLLCIAYN